ncbi:CBS domain protein, partial [human gut metagenome]
MRGAAKAAVHSAFPFHQDNLQRSYFPAMNLLFFLTPKQDVLFIYEDFTLRQTLEKWSNQRFATIPVLKRNGEYLGTMTEGDILWGIKSIHGL